VSKLAAFNESCKIVLDLQRPDASSIWEAIPFTWLVDYFLNVGDALHAVENTDKVLPTDICIMKHRVVTVEYVGIVPGNTPGDLWQRNESFSAGKTTYDVKLRETANPTSASDLLSFGFMSKGQATNLIALIASLTRFR
jgi:hypothetical protein